MSEIGEKAEKIWRKKTEIIRRKKELTEKQTKHYANLILDVFEASNELYCVSKVIVGYTVGADSNHLYCRVQFFDNDGKTNQDIYTNVNNDKVLGAMNNVNACETEDRGIIARIYNLLATDSQVTKYFEVTLDEQCEIITIKIRPEEDVTLDETICENEEPEE